MNSGMQCLSFLFFRLVSLHGSLKKLLPEDYRSEKIEKSPSDVQVIVWNLLFSDATLYSSVPESNDLPNKFCVFKFIF